MTPGGRIYLSKSTTQGLQLDSMWVGTIQNCKVKPLAGAAFTKK